MSEKLDKIGADRDRAKEKRDQWDARYKELCQKYIQQENTEIHEMVRAQNLTPDQLADILKVLQSKPTLGTAALSGNDHITTENKEDEQHED